MTYAAIPPRGGPVLLAREADFALGPLRVRPSRGEVEYDGASERLEPRVMQVLVALAQRDGLTISREELTDRCWGGLAVSPDAINRVISRLRRLADQQPQAFRIETLARIGYRLTGLGETSVSNGAVGPVHSDPLVQDLYARALLALEQPSREPIEQAHAYLSEVVARAPDHAPAWAALAEAQRLQMLYMPPPEQGGRRADSRSSAERALALDARLGQAFGTLAMLTSRFNRWAEVESLFERGLAAAPDHPALVQQHAQFLLSVGRTAEGLRRLQGLEAGNPLSAAVAVEVATALFDTGRRNEALAAISRAHALWPAIMLVWSECVRLHVVAGDYARAEALLDAPPPSVQPDDPNLARRRLHMVARRDRRPEDIAAAIDNFTSFAELGVAPATVAVHALTTLDQPGPAIAIADRIFRAGAPQTQRPGVNMMATFTLAGEPDTTVLFRLDTRPIVGSAQVETIFERIGLSAYWRNAKARPDFLGGEVASAAR